MADGHHFENHLHISAANRPNLMKFVRQT